MPTYEYQCTECGSKFEVRASIKAKQQGLKPACPSCGSTKALPAFRPIAIGSGSKASPSGCCGGSGCCTPARR